MRLCSVCVSVFGGHFGKIVIEKLYTLSVYAMMMCLH